MKKCKDGGLVTKGSKHGPLTAKGPKKKGAIGKARTN